MAAKEIHPLLSDYEKGEIALVKLTDIKAIWWPGYITRCHPNHLSIGFFNERSSQEVYSPQNIVKYHPEDQKHKFEQALNFLRAKKRRHLLNKYKADLDIASYAYQEKLVVEEKLYEVKKNGGDSENENIGSDQHDDEISIRALTTDEPGEDTENVIVRMKLPNSSTGTESPHDLKHDSSNQGTDQHQLPPVKAEQQILIEDQVEAREETNDTVRSPSQPDLPLPKSEIAVVGKQGNSGLETHDDSTEETSEIHPMKLQEILAEHLLKSLEVTNASEDTSETATHLPHAPADQECVHQETFDRGIQDSASGPVDQEMAVDIPKEWSELLVEIPVELVGFEETSISRSLDGMLNFEDAEETNEVQTQSENEMNAEGTEGKEVHMHEEAKISEENSTHHYIDKTGKFRIRKIIKSETDNYHQAPKKHQRCRNTIHACALCAGNESFANISKHLRTHTENPLIMEILQMEKEAMNAIQEMREELERTIGYRLSLLRLKGDDDHNKKVQENGTGELYISRRSAQLENFNITDFIVCEKCHMWLHTAHNLHQHDKNCLRLKNEKQCKTPEEASHQDISSLRHKLKDSLTNDVIKEIILKNDLLMELGMFRAGSNYGNATGCLKYGRDRMRRIGHLIQLMNKSYSEELTLEQLLAPEYFDAMCESASGMGKLNSAEECTPNTVKRIKEDLIQCCRLKEVMARSDSQGEQDAHKLRKKIELFWTPRIGAKASALASKKRHIQKNKIPLPSDISKISTFLQKELSAIKVDTYADYKRAVILTQCRLITFNRRRPGDLHNLTLEEYKQRTIKTNAPPEIESSLTTLEKHLLQQTELLITRGKGGRPVPVLLPKDVTPALTIIVDEEVRSSVGITSELIFANTGNGVHDIGASLRIIRGELDLQDPDLITSTLMRKDIATTCQMLDMTPNEVGYLVKHLSHGIKIHEDYYQTMTDVIERTKVGLLLHLKDVGLLEKFKDRRINEITLQDVEDVDVDGRIFGATDDDNDATDGEVIECMGESSSLDVSSDALNCQEPDEARTEPKRKKRKAIRINWQKHEATLKYVFRVELKNRVIPRKHTIEEKIDGTTLSDISYECIRQKLLRMMKA